MTLSTDFSNGASPLRPGSLKVRLIALVVVVTLATVSVLSISLTFFTTERTSALLKERAANLATVMSSLLSAVIDFEQYDAAAEHLAALANSPGASYAAVYQADGTVVARWGTVPARRVHPHVGGAPRTDPAKPVALTIEAVDMIHIATPVGTTGNTTLVVGVSRREEEREKSAIIRTAVITALLLLPLLGMVGIGVAGGIARPLLDMAKTAEAIARGDRVALTQLPTNRGDEAGKVARAFRQLLEQEHQGQILLEERVTERTTALRRANDELSLRLGQLAEAQEQVAASARAAGMAEIAVGVLHNVGNVLNSVNVSAQCAGDALTSSRLPALRQAIQLMSKHEHDLASLFASNNGATLYRLLSLTTESIDAAWRAALQELSGLRTNIEHINTLVATQQTYASAGAFVEKCKLGDVVRAALSITAASFGRDQIHIAQRVDDIEMTTDRHKLIQILVNLLTNARHAVKDGERERRVDIVAERLPNATIRVAVSDRGVGIDAETMAKLFRHGFTTKKTGHGFGLHASANAAKELGGSLLAASDGSATARHSRWWCPRHDRRRT